MFHALLQYCNKIAPPQQISRAAGKAPAMRVEIRGFPATGHIGIKFAY
jgi:hypothetical protein